MPEKPTEVEKLENLADNFSQRAYDAWSESGEDAHESLVLQRSMAALQMEIRAARVAIVDELSWIRQAVQAQAEHSQAVNPAPRRGSW